MGAMVQEQQIPALTFLQRLLVDLLLSVQPLPLELLRVRRRGERKRGRTLNLAQLLLTLAVELHLLGHAARQWLSTRWRGEEKQEGDRRYLAGNC